LGGHKGGIQGGIWKANVESVDGRGEMIDMSEICFREIERDRKEGGSNEEGRIVEEEGVNGEEDGEMSFVEVEAECEVEVVVNEETGLIWHSGNVHVSVGRIRGSMDAHIGQALDSWGFLAGRGSMISQKFM
jgi:hypothetical protein